MPRRRPVVAIKSAPDAHSTAPPTFEDLPDLCTPAQARAFLQIGRTHIYELVKTGALPSLKFGTTVRIPKRALLGGGQEESGAPMVTLPTRRRA